MEDRSRCNNLHFDGLTEDPNDTWEDCERKVQDALLNNLNIEDNIEIDYCHHFGKRRGSRPRTIVCRFLPFKDKQKILQNAKKLKILEYLYTRTFGVIPWNCESCYGGKYWNTIGRVSMHI